MRRRRATFIAATVAAVVFATLSLGAREDWKEPTAETCKTNLAAVFDWCGIKEHAGCQYVDEKEVDACEAGCVMALCPEQITCTELDPMWCGSSCADSKGARYWSDSYVAWRDCDYVVADDEDGELDWGQFTAWRACQLAYRKQRCPELTRRPRQPPPSDDPAE